jgi:hypothetical protein
MSPKSTSSNSVQIVQPPPLTIIDLSVESIEDLMMANEKEQKASSDNKTTAPNNKVTNETSAQKVKSSKEKRKHVATGNPRERPPRDPSKDVDRDMGQVLA